MPAKPLASLMGVEGGRCAIIANGPSVPGPKDLGRIPYYATVIGVNRSFHRVGSKYQVIIDREAIKQYGHRLPNTCGTEGVFTRHKIRGRGSYMIKSLAPGIVFSTNLCGGWVVQGATSAAMQLAVFLGFQRIDFVGLDLKIAGGRLHFYEERQEHHWPKFDFKNQLTWMADAAEWLASKRPDISVFNTSITSVCAAWEKIPFDVAFPK